MDKWVAGEVMIEKITDAIIFKLIRERYSKAVPFHNFLGLKVSKFNYEVAEITLPWNENLVGNATQMMLHGGVTATVLDAVGGLAAVGNFVSKEKHQSADFIKKRISRMGTVDLRIDYLLPGKGDKFTATARVIRAGKRLTVCRMEMHNDQGQCIAMGTGTYLWSD